MSIGSHGECLFLVFMLLDDFSFLLDYLLRFGISASYIEEAVEMTQSSL